MRVDRKRFGPSLPAKKIVIPVTQVFRVGNPSFVDDRYNSFTVAEDFLNFLVTGRGFLTFFLLACEETDLETLNIPFPRLLLF